MGAKNPAEPLVEAVKPEPFVAEKAAAEEAGAKQIVVLEPLQKGTSVALRVDH